MSANNRNFLVTGLSLCNRTGETNNMPRRPAAAANVVQIDTRSVRLRPPANMPAPERDVFVALVATNPPSHFRASDMVLLVQYCAAAVLNDRAVAELRTAPIVDGKPSPWLQIFEKTNRAVVALALRLRISPQARAPNTPTRRESPVSAYEMLRLRNADDQ
jgi:hypothetical protein